MGMSTLFETVIDPESRKIIFNCDNNSKLVKTKKSKCALKSKENIFKPQCRRELKKKLKKYKLRRDGQEDPEVLDVSQILVSTLKIKSPTSTINNNVLSEIQEELRPKNYLFKMGRRKLISKRNGLDKSINDGKSQKESQLSKSDNNIKSSKKTEEHTISLNDTQEVPEDKKVNNKDKKQTNAFQLMMDSRNKSIGSNSPGKDKVDDETELQEHFEKKCIKAKRNLLLQKMAEAKGSLKNKEMEEYHEQCIQKKMEKRAQRLKKMVLSKQNKKSKHVDDNVTLHLNKNSNLADDESDIEIVTTQNETANDKKHSLSKTKTLKLVNMFHDPVQNVSPISKNVKTTKDDEEFLKKLSPSIKKKENMLCYFKKVDKEQESDEIFSNECVEDERVIIKVKMTPKSKKSLKKKKLSLNKDLINAEPQNGYDENTEIVPEPSNIMNHDRHGPTLIISDMKNSENHKDVIRPRRTIKRPAKYVEDVHPSSSDEELHIFTPKKKKQTKNDVSVSEEKQMTQPSEPLKNLSKDKKSSSSKKHAKLTNDDTKQKKPTKLAPIFAKPQTDAAAIEAKQRFLSSGVPEKLKKIVEKQSSINLGENTYHTVVHVQQKDLVIPYTVCEFNFSQSDDDGDPVNVLCERGFFKNIISSTTQFLTTNSNLLFEKEKANDILHKIKQSYPKFPVYRTFRLLRDKNRGELKDCSYLNLDNSIEIMNGIIDINTDSPDKLSWTDKYKATSSKQILGNFENIKELKKWLVSWTENDAKLKKTHDENSDSSDFYHSDTDSKDSMKCTNNLLVLNGPSGSGKTSIVYAVAADLSIKVLEVNASSKRTGKIMLQDLQEATQSHKVNRGKSSQENSQKSQEIVASNNEVQSKIKKRGRPKKAAVVETTLKKTESMANVEDNNQPSSQDSSRTCMSLILIDDADIVFEQDDGFCSAIVQLVQCSKRPVILITSSLTCPHLQRFLQIAKVLHTRPYFPRMLGTWLDILCLADNGMCRPGLGPKILDYFNGDIRKSINFLQFYTVSDFMNDAQTSSQSSDLSKIDLVDENSSMSWTDREGNDERNDRSNAINNIDVSIWHCLMKDQASLFHFRYPPKLFNIWWNIPRLVNVPSYCQTGGDNVKSLTPEDETRHMSGLDAISNVADMISIADCYRQKDKEFELTAVPWATFESHSVSEQESLDKYDRNREVMDEISHSLVTGSILTVQRSLGLEQNTHLEFPGMAIKREREKVASRHTNVSSYLNPSATLDRRALALDYWSACRSICRIEKSRTDNNSKRNNRFCHYLKSANILCKSDCFDNLGNSLCSKDSI